MLYIKNKSISYKELFLKALSVSKFFENLGIKENDKIILLLPVSIELYCILLALFKLKATVISIEPRIINNLKNIVIHTNPKAIIYNYYFQILRVFNKRVSINLIPIKIVDSILTFKDEVKLGFSDIKMLDCSECNLKEEIFTNCFSEDIAIISFTSGSTLTPKGVIRTYKNLFKQGEYLYKNMNINQTDIDFTNLPLFALKNIYYNISTFLYYVKNWNNINIKDLVSCIKRSTTITVSLGILKVIVNYCKKRGLKIDNIRLIYTGGAPVYLSFLKKVKEVFINAEIEVLYGSTEVEPISHINLNELERLPDFEGVCVGKPINQIDTKIINKIKVYNINGFEVGEIVINGDNTAIGYIPYNLDQNKIKIDSKLYHKVGDIGYFDSFGNLWLLGKAENKIYINDFYLFPLQVEKLVDQIEDVQKSALVLYNNNAIIFIKLNQNNSNIKKNVKFKVENLIKEKFKDLNLNFLIIFDDIPLDNRHNSKIDYNKLQSKIHR